MVSVMRKTKKFIPRKSLEDVSQEDPVIIYTDGGCRPNPGPGGWGAILQSGNYEKEMFGGEHNTTNNRMELVAAASALEALTRPCKVIIYVDSEYVRQGITDWCHSWRRRNWTTASGSPVVNVDLWKRLLEAEKPHRVTWKWVKAHA